MRTLLVFGACLLCACGGDSRPGGDGAAASMDSGVGRDGAPPPLPDGAPAPDGSRPGDDAGPPPPELRFCQLGCASVADCATASPAFDADNYACEGGACRYTGCVDDGECRATFMDDRYVCRDPGTGTRSCVQGCASAADCGTGTPAFDADNYACEGGLCFYTGCRTDAECEATFMSSAYGCFAVEPPATPLPVPTAERNCVRRCASPPDCDSGSPAFDADNYACEGGSCRYLGCNGDGECAASLMRSDAVCR
ncbi:MAG: hypothetical protein RLO52_15750 [Sandaracinaceae bacterium]